MPDIPIKPPNKNKKVDELVTVLTLKASEMFEHEAVLLSRYPKMLTYLTRELAIAMLKLEEHEKLK